MFLVTFHFFYFAIPAYKKFRDAGVAVEVIEEDVGHLSLPAVTFCPYRHHSAWKNGSILNPLGIYETHCKGAHSREEILSCIDTGTFNITETFPYRTLTVEVED